MALNLDECICYFYKCNAAITQPLELTSSGSVFRKAAMNTLTDTEHYIDLYIITDNFIFITVFLDHSMG